MRPTPSPSTRTGARAPVPRTVWTLAACLAATACATPTTRVAPFRDRPDSVEAGDLQGPFSGRVVDAASGEPVAGAFVYATWGITGGYGHPSPAGFREHVTSTDADGHYEIPALEDWGDKPGERLSEFHLVVYKRGFVAYRSDRRFSDLGPRRDFTQHRNDIALRRWRPEFSHARHLRYVGGGPALVALTSWERKDAAAELSGARQIGPQVAPALRPATGTGTGVVAAQLLSAEKVKEITGYSGEFETGPLGDQPDTKTYTSQHFRALDKPESYDVALRLWKPDSTEAASERYRALESSLPEVDEQDGGDGLATRSFRTKEPGILGIALIDEERGAVALLTCGQAQCANHDIAAELARAAYDELRRLWPLGEE